MDTVAIVADVVAAALSGALVTPPEPVAAFAVQTVALVAVVKNVAAPFVPAAVIDELDAPGAVVIAELVAFAYVVA